MALRDWLWVSIQIYVFISPSGRLLNLDLVLLLDELLLVLLLLQNLLVLEAQGLLIEVHKALNVLWMVERILVAWKLYESWVLVFNHSRREPQNVLIIRRQLVILWSQFIFSYSIFVAALVMIVISWGNLLLIIKLIAFFLLGGKTVRKVPPGINSFWVWLSIICILFFRLNLLVLLLLLHLVWI